MANPIHTAQTCRNLSDAADQIGSLIECNGRFESLLAQHIEATGKAVNDLTVGELMQHIQQCRDEFNQKEARYG